MSLRVTRGFAQHPHELRLKHAGDRFASIGEDCEGIAHANLLMLASVSRKLFSSEDGCASRRIGERNIDHEPDAPTISHSGPISWSGVRQCLASGNRRGTPQHPSITWTGRTREVLMTLTNHDLEEMVDWQNGSLSPEIFTNEEIYRRELEKVFGVRGSSSPTIH